MRLLNCTLSLALLAGALSPAAADTISLGNEPWPPFVLEGDTRGTAEEIVCEALARAGHECALRYDDWDATLAAAESGEIDGIAAAWYTPERGRSLQFSSSYLTNRLVPVTLAGADAVRSIADLAGKRVALEVDVAYGEALLAARDGFEVVEVHGSPAALKVLRDGRADVAVLDELFLLEALDSTDADTFAVGDVALVFRELHFAVSRTRPDAQQLVADFNQAYQVMLRDGTVNRILGLEWLATDLGSDGVMDFIHSGGGLSAAVADVASSDRVYALGQDEYEAIRDPGFQGSNARYLSDDTAYETPEAAMKALDTDKRCRYDSRTAQIVCSGR
jgi:ABC-type amino acid transport substrate-binding protein